MEAEQASMTRGRSRTRVARSGALLLSGTLTANVLSYVFFVVLSRHLSQGSLGAVGAMVNLTAIAAVPALGLQLVAAREVSRARHQDLDDESTATVLGHRSLRLGLELGLVAAVVLIVLSPVLASLLSVDVPTLLLLGASLVPLGLTYAAQGVLQGAERFGRLALVLAATGVARVAAGTLPVWLGGDVLLVVALLAAGWLVTAAVALALLPRRVRRFASRHPTPLRRMATVAIVPTSGLLVLSSIDVLLARHHLPADASGAYTIGALFEKAAFWGLAFVATLLYPGMAREDERRRAIGRALAVTAGVGAIGVLVTALLPGPLVLAVGGPTYAALTPALWRFTLLGCLLAVVQVLVYADLAASRTWAGTAVWAGAATAVAAAQLAHRSVGDIVTVMLSCVGGLVVFVLAVELRRAAPLRRRQ